MTWRVIILTVLCWSGNLLIHSEARAVANPDAPSKAQPGLQPLFSEIPALAVVPDAYKDTADAYQRGYLGTVSGEKHSGERFMPSERVCSEFSPTSREAAACGAGRIAGESLLAEGMMGKPDPNAKPCGYDFDKKTGDPADARKRCECLRDQGNGKIKAEEACRERKKLTQPATDVFAGNYTLGMPSVNESCSITSHCDWCGHMTHQVIRYDHLTCWGLGFRVGYMPCDTGTNIIAELQSFAKSKGDGSHPDGDSPEDGMSVFSQSGVAPAK